MVKFDRTILPGKEGVITLSVHVYPSWAGQKFVKRAMVMTNDPETANIYLKLSGRVESKPAAATKKDEAS